MAARDQLEAILEKVRTSRNFDFRNYKRATLERRIERRMAERKLPDHAAIPRPPDSEPEELDALISALLIKVTSFFRDPEMWEALRTHDRPAAAAPEAPRRRGAAHLERGLRHRRGGLLHRLSCSRRRWAPLQRREVKVFGTDVDEAAIAFARRGVYGAAQVEGSRTEQLARWFTPGPRATRCARSIRRTVVFGANNLVSDAPISRIDLLLCRNVFIYLDAELQQRRAHALPLRAAPAGRAGARASASSSPSPRTHLRADRPRAPHLPQGVPASWRWPREERSAASSGAGGRCARGPRVSREKLARSATCSAELLDGAALPDRSPRRSTAPSPCGTQAAARLWRRTDTEVLRQEAARARPPRPDGRPAGGEDHRGARRAIASGAAAEGRLGHRGPRRARRAAGPTSSALREGGDAAGPALRRAGRHRACATLERAARRARGASSGDRGAADRERGAAVLERGAARPRTRSCSPRTRSCRPRTRSCSRPTRSWRPPTRSCSRPTPSSTRPTASSRTAPRS